MKNNVILLVIGNLLLLHSCYYSKRTNVSRPVKIQVNYSSIDSIKAESYFKARPKILKSLINGFKLTDQGEFISPVYKVELELLPENFVTDFENILSEAQEKELNNLLNEYEKQTSTEIGIVTLPMHFVPTESFDSLVLDFSRNWSVGKRKSYNGVFIGISLRAKHIRICTATGIQVKLTDTECSNIINSIFIPEVKKDEIFIGIKNSIEEIKSELDK